MRPHWEKIRGQVSENTRPSSASCSLTGLHGHRRTPAENLAIDSRGGWSDARAGARALKIFHLVDSLTRARPSLLKIDRSKMITKKMMRLKTALFLISTFITIVGSAPKTRTYVRA